VTTPTTARGANGRVAPARAGRRLRAALAAGFTVLLCLTAAGCVSLPDSGAVRSGPAMSESAVDTAPAFNPPGPSRGDTPTDIVTGFLGAMQANPLTTAVAREFLTDAAGADWDPGAATVIYSSWQFEVDDDAVTISFSDVARLDRKGAWLGRSEGPDAYTAELELVREQGEWRIADPPPALIVPDTYFESRFDEYSLYFFDKSAQVLVPEPVYLPRGKQTPTLLVSGLLQGPDQGLLGVERSFIPAATEVDLSVPVSENGTVEVPLSDEVLDLSAADLQMVSAQLAWTLRQVDGVVTLRITVDGSPLEVPGFGTEQSIMGWDEFDPSVNWASEAMFGLRDGRVVTLVGGEVTRVSGTLGSQDLGARSIAVDLPAQQVAAVTGEGTTVLVAPRADVGSEQAAEPVVVFSGGANLLAPAWDIYGQVWLIDRTVEGAVVYVVRGSVPRALVVPGISGTQVKDFEISRDGTRLVAVVSEGGQDSLVVSRVARDSKGRVRKILAADPIPVGQLEVKQIRDIAWRSPETLALLIGPQTFGSQVVLPRIDGSTVGESAPTPEAFRTEAVRVATSPAGVGMYVATSRGQLFELAADARWVGTAIQRGLVSPVFVG